jgi:hypothetical protein
VVAVVRQTRSPPDRAGAQGRGTAGRRSPDPGGAAAAHSRSSRRRDLRLRRRPHRRRVRRPGGGATDRGAVRPRAHRADRLPRGAARRRGGARLRPVAWPPAAAHRLGLPGAARPAGGGAALAVACLPGTARPGQDPQARRSGRRAARRTARRGGYRPAHHAGPPPVAVAGPQGDRGAPPAPVPHAPGALDRHDGQVRGRRGDRVPRRRRGARRRCDPAVAASGGRIPVRCPSAAPGAEGGHLHHAAAVLRRAREWRRPRGAEHAARGRAVQTPLASGHRHQPAAPARPAAYGPTAVGGRLRRGRTQLGQEPGPSLEGAGRGGP